MIESKNNNTFLKGFISFPFSLACATITYYIFNITLIEFKGVFFEWIFYFLNVIFKGFIVGFLLLKVFLNFNKFEKIKFKYWYLPLYFLQIFYIYLITYLMSGFLIRGFDSFNSKTIIENDWFSGGISFNTYKYMFIGSITGIFYYFKTIISNFYKTY